MPDGPDEQDAAAGTPDDADASATPDGTPPEPAIPELAPQPLPTFHAVDDLPPAPPQVELINDDDLSWLDKPQKTEEELEARRERREIHRKKVKRQRRSRRILKVGGVSAAVLLVLGGLWFWWTFGGLERMPASAGQAGLNTPGTNILLIGSNPDEPDSADVPGDDWKHTFGTSDMVMILHLTRDNRQMYVISIPADAVVPIEGQAPGKLTDAYAAGGEKLFVKTVETLSGIRMDRVAALDMNGLREITDEIGGVIVEVPSSACNIPAGARRLDGAQALQYVALYPCLPGKDLDRVERQQTLLKALMRGAVDGGKITNPFTLNRLLRTTSGHLTLEDDFGYPSILGQVFSMRHLRSTSTTFLTVPVADDPYTTLAGRDAIRLDPDKDLALWDALRQDRLADYLRLDENADALR